MSTWTRGRIYSRAIETPGRSLWVEIRDDIADGWEWTVYVGANSMAVGVADTLEQAKRAAMREAKRKGGGR